MDISLVVCAMRNNLNGSLRMRNKNVEVEVLGCYTKTWDRTTKLVSYRRLAGRTGKKDETGDREENKVGDEDGDGDEDEDEDGDGDGMRIR
ncbi:hypothetical protein PABG_02261 [Paracoccidioides brasiliensis Pb03]|nr:hypothetical protein PABG_02261 [Paracoccidioides brasiliensis Pb03]